MSDEAGGSGGEGEAKEQDPKPGADEERTRGARERMSDGLNRGLSVLSALKEALEETISEARERGDLSVDRASKAMKDAMGRAREATSEARERFDFVTQAEFDELASRVRDLEDRVRSWDSRPEGDATGEP